MTVGKEEEKYAQEAAGGLRDQGHGINEERGGGETMTSI